MKHEVKFDVGKALLADLIAATDALLSPVRQAMEYAEGVSRDVFVSA